MSVRQDIRVRFWSKVNLIGSIPSHRPELGNCWLWQAGLKNGYGEFNMGWQFNHRAEYAHRFSYASLFGPIPDNKELDHLCRVPNCVNPTHLEAVSHLVNMKRGCKAMARNSKTHCVHGHAYTESNTFINSTGRKECYTCRKYRYALRKAQA